jgi:hypothetical protein
VESDRTPGVVIWGAAHDLEVLPRQLAGVLRPVPPVPQSLPPPVRSDSQQADADPRVLSVQVREVLAEKMSERLPARSTSVDHPNLET